MSHYCCNWLHRFFLVPFSFLYLFLILYDTWRNHHNIGLRTLFFRDVVLRLKFVIKCNLFFLNRFECFEIFFNIHGVFNWWKCMSSDSSCNLTNFTNTISFDFIAVRFLINSCALLSKTIDEIRKRYNKKLTNIITNKSQFMPCRRFWNSLQFVVYKFVGWESFFFIWRKFS